MAAEPSPADAAASAGMPGVAEATNTPQTVLLDGHSLSPETLYAIGYNEGYTVGLTEEAWARVRRARAVVERMLEDDTRVVFGINTGVGAAAHKILPFEHLCLLQENLVLSHCAGIGRPLSFPRAKMLLVARINALAFGRAGVCAETIAIYLDALNRNLIPRIPEQGTGGSGDFAPLAHMAAAFLGHGELWCPKKGTWAPASEVAAAYSLAPLKLQPKEGLALISGTQFVTTFACEALVRAELALKQANVVAALSIEALRGTRFAFDYRIHNARPFRGQVGCAAMIRSLLHSDEHPSPIFLSCPHNVQDAYSLRCIPQVHGVTWDTLVFARKILTTELNSDTGNPMVCAATGDILCGGNMHGEYPGKIADILAISVAELGSICERRIERMMNGALNGPSVVAQTDPNAAKALRLPDFLVESSGLNSGFMVAHTTAASLVSENKVLTHPASCDSITTCSGQEDHVAMSGFSGRKLLTIVRHIEYIISIELMCACQGLDFLAPLTPSEPLRRLHELVRTRIPAFEKDRHLAPLMKDARALIRHGLVWKSVRDHVDAEMTAQGLNTHTFPV
eukprot:c17257_g1_i2.p1 GENE.c17257_g1_i2~~c17257_g1_i2.p1  ORF type:complete len:568 (+),score=103.62 c17257_g1_i2:87-1790(+)